MSARGQSTPTAKERSRVIEEALQRFPTLPTLTLARHLLHNYGYLFEYNLETVRHESLELLLAEMDFYLEKFYAPEFVQTLNHNIINRLERVLPLLPK